MLRHLSIRGNRFNFLAKIRSKEVTEITQVRLLIGAQISAFVGVWYRSFRSSGVWNVNWGCQLAILEVLRFTEASVLV